eukprot:GEMP01006497.1.p1 GENE.GEMP01006497.1~~GEMP01006497.1.p1  ORF type:complete len:445 (+),score=74.35 GEMP01006497.1:115-1449(+)
MSGNATNIDVIDPDDVEAEVFKNSRILLTAKTNEWSSDTRECYNDTHFAKIRRTLKLTEDWLDWIDYDNLRDGGGKGGDLMCLSPNQYFVVKELNQQDHESLLAFAECYVDHLIDGPSLLCIILIHFNETTRGKNYFVMTNCLSCRSSPWVGRYDLKGCQDDKALEIDGQRVTEVHKRIWKVHMWCGKCFWSEKRALYFKNKKAAYNLKLSVCSDDRPKIMEALERDVKLLQDNGLLDYSMLVGIKHEPRRPSRHDSGPEGVTEFKNYSSRKSVMLEFRNRKFLTAAPGHLETQTQILYIGIIDFLQRWSAKKQIARVIKVFERNKPTIPPKRYGARFLKHFQQSIVGNGISPDATGSPVIMSLPQGTYILNDRDAAVTTNNDGSVGGSGWSGWTVGAEHDARSVNVHENTPDESTTATDSTDKIKIKQISDVAEVGDMATVVP